MFGNSGFKKNNGIKGHNRGKHHESEGDIFFGGGSQSLLRRERIAGEGSYSFMGEKDFGGDALRPEPFSKRRAEREKKKYPFHSDIQEIHDKMQELYTSGTALVDQKTMDITDTQYATKIPFEMAGITFKAIGFLILYVLAFAVLDFLLCFVAPHFMKGFGYNPLLSLIGLPIFFSIFFYKFFIMSMRQYVIREEKQSKTLKFYSIVKGIWYPVEVAFYAITAITLFAYWRLDAWFKYIQPYWSKVGEVLHLKTMSEPLIQKVGENIQKNEYICGYFANFALFFCVATIMYVIFSYLLNKHFVALQRENNLNLLLQHNFGKAVDMVLDGEI